MEGGNADDACGERVIREWDGQAGSHGGGEPSGARVAEIGTEKLLVD
jgi:hypothetical protein